VTAAVPAATAVASHPVVARVDMLALAAMPATAVQA
jgi:hypothetical protein